MSFGALDVLFNSTVSISSIVVTNVGNIPVSLIVLGSTATLPSSPWVLGAAQDVDVPVLQGLWNTLQPGEGSFSTPITNDPRISGGGGGDYAGDQNGQAVPVGARRVLWFRFVRPTSTSSTAKEIFKVEVRPIFP